MTVKTLSKKTTDLKWLKCPVCGRHDYYFRTKTCDYACKRCPALFKADYQHHTTYLIGDRSNTSCPTKNLPKKH